MDADVRFGATPAAMLGPRQSRNPNSQHPVTASVPGVDES